MDDPTVIEGTATEVPQPIIQHVPDSSATLTSPVQSAVISAPPQQTGIAAVTAEKLMTLGDALGIKDLKPTEAMLFAEVANRSGLDPFAKQIYAIKRGGKLGFQTGIDGYRSIAARTGEYDGQDEPTYGPTCECGEVMKLDGSGPAWHPESATVRVYRKGMGRGVAATAYWHEYWPGPGEEVTRWDNVNGKSRPAAFKPKTGNARDDAMYVRMPRNQLAKVAEALALRKGFPYIYAGLYTDDEMAQARDGEITAVVASAAPAPLGTAPAAVTAGPASGGQAPPRPVGPAPTAPPPQQAAPPAPPAQAPAAAPEGDVGVWEGTVKDTPDGMRSTASGPKLELAFVVGRSKHTAIVFGEWARPIVELQLPPETPVRVHGRKVEIEWQTGKPKKKEIHDVTALEYLASDGQWYAFADPGMPLVDSTTARAPHAVAQAPSAEDDGGPPLFDDDELRRPVVEQALPVKPQVAEDGLDVPFATGEGNVDFIGVVNVNRDEAGKGGATFRYLEIGTADIAYRCAVLAADVEALRPTRFWSGARVRVIGGWSSSGKLVVVTHMEPAA